MNFVSWQGHHPRSTTRCETCRPQNCDASYGIKPATYTIRRKMIRDKNVQIAEKATPFQVNQDKRYRKNASGGKQNIRN